MKQTADEVAYKLFPDSIAAYKGFLDGAAWQAKQSPWVKAGERLPYVDENYNSLQSEPVLVQLSEKEWFEPEILIYNKHYNTWDTADGDDAECKVSDDDLWMPIPGIDE